MEGRFRWFVEAAWHVLNPSRPFTGGWHIDLFCEHAEAMHKREIRRLVINVPPGHSKSLIFCVFFNVWAWIRNPGESFIYGSNDLGLPTRDGARVVALVRSQWFQERWGDRFFFSEEKDPEKANADPAASSLYTSARAFRLAVSPGGKGVGYHAGVRILDDPNKPNKADAKEAEAVRDWFSNTFATRAAAGDRDVIAVIGQRVGPYDVSDLAIELGYQRVCLPFDYDAERSIITTGIGADPRTTPGEMLWSPPHTEETRAQLAKDLGSEYNWETQCQQNGRPKKGPAFSSDWLGERWAEIPDDAFWFQVWDLAFEGDKKSDYVVGHVWAVTQARAYLVHRFRDKCDFDETIAQIEAQIEAYPQAAAVHIERKANGHAALNTLSKKFPGLLPIVPTESKFQRAMSVTALVKSGAVLLAPDDPAGMKQLTGELSAFPFGRHDDDADVFVHALRIWQERRATFADAMAAAKDQGMDLADIFDVLAG